MIVWLQASLLGAAAVAALLVPEMAHGENSSARRPVGAFLTLLRIPSFRHLVLAAALILGSHAMHDPYAIRTLPVTTLSARRLRSQT
jgi:PPP family 3-phenylpropionic acid transporter